MQIINAVINIIKQPIIWYLGIFILFAITPTIIEKIIYRREKKRKNIF